MDVSNLDEPMLWLEADLAEASFYGVPGATIGVYSSRSPDRAAANEDGMAVIPLADGGVVLALADGFGGGPGGERASRLALEELQAVAKASEQQVREAILAGFEGANRKVLNTGTGCATTLLAAELTHGSIRTYNVGDTMLVVVGQRGKVKLRTLPHSPVGYAVESGWLDEEEAMHHEDRHYVSNMVGAPDMRIELTSAYDLAPLDTVVLGTDGLWDNLHFDEVVEAVRKGPLEEVARMLAESCRERMRAPKEGLPSKPDDCTFILYRRLGE